MEGSKRLTIVALVALLFIGITVDADRTAASFTATTDNPGNQFVTARLALSNDKSTAGALVNLSLTLDGAIPVNLNFTAGREAVQQSIDYSVAWYLARPGAIVKSLQGIYRLDSKATAA